MITKSFVGQIHIVAGKPCNSTSETIGYRAAFASHNSQMGYDDITCNSNAAGLL